MPSDGLLTNENLVGRQAAAQSQSISKKLIYVLMGTLMIYAAVRCMLAAAGKALWFDEHRKFLIYVEEKDWIGDWLTARLRKEGWTVQTVASEGYRRVYLASANVEHLAVK